MMKLTKIFAGFFSAAGIMGTLLVAIPTTVLAIGGTAVVALLGLGIVGIVGSIILFFAAILL